MNSKNYEKIFKIEKKIKNDVSISSNAEHIFQFKIIKGRTPWTSEVILLFIYLRKMKH